jgi:hypothetical protein
MQVLFRIEHPSEQHMIVEARLDRDYLERALKLVLICHKIRTTMHGAATVTINSGCGPFVLLDAKQVIKWIMAKAGVKEWQAVQYLVVPDDLLLGNIGRCIVLAGMRSSTVVIDEQGLCFQGRDDRYQYSSVKVHRHGLSTLLAMASICLGQRRD